MQNGWVKLWRSIDDNELLSDDNTCYIVFTKLLTRANKQTGVFTTGRNKLASICNLKPSTVYYALKRLESSAMVRQQADSRKTTIYICNWDKYQQVGDRTINRHRADIGTKQEGEEEREYIKGKDKELLALLNEKTNRSFRTLPNGYKKTLEAFSLEEIGQALDNMKKDEWHAPRLNELKSDYLLRSSTIDNMLARSAKEEKTNGNDWFNSQSLDIY